MTPRKYFLAAKGMGARSLTRMLNVSCIFRGNKNPFVTFGSVFSQKPPIVRRSSLLSDTILAPRPIQTRRSNSVRGQNQSMATTIINSPRDPNTLSNYNNWISTHTTANFDVLFDQKKLAGNVVHRLKSVTDAQAHDIILDTSHLGICDVKVDGKSSPWELLPPLDPYGTALKIKLGHGVKLNETVEVDVCHQLELNHTSWCW